MMSKAKKQRDRLGQFLKGSSGFRGKHSEESKQKMSRSHKETAWTKGLTKETDERVRKYAAKVSATLMGHRVSKESREKMRKAKLGVKRSSKICKVEKRDRIEPNKPAYEPRVKLPGVRFGKGSCHSEESKKKMSASHTGSKSWNEGLTKETDERLLKCGAKITMALKGRHASEEAKANMRKAWKEFDPRKRKTWIEKISAGTKGRKLSPEVSERRRGHGNPNWRGGKSFEPYPIGWTRTFKEQIRFRDRYTCQVCRVPEAECDCRLCVHHKDYDKSNIEPNNLVSLCRSCHTKTNYHREEWRRFFEQQNNSL